MGRLRVSGRRRTSGAGLALLTTLILLAGALAAVPKGSVAAITQQGAIELSPRDYIAGEQLTITGTLGVPGVRSVVLQRWMRDRYLDKARGRTAADGSFSFTVTGPGMATPFSVYAPDLGVRTPRAPVSPQDQVVSVAPRRTTAVPGQTIRIAVTSSPARPGRPIVLQQRVSPTEWVRVGKKTADAEGTTRFRITPDGSTSVTYRAVAAAMDGTGIAAFASFPRTFALTGGSGSSGGAEPRSSTRPAPVVRRAAARAAYTQPGPIHAGNTFGWYPLAWSHDWEWGEPVSPWQAASDGSGRVSIYRAMLALDSGPTNRADDNHGTVAAVRGGTGQADGRWEIRMRVPHWSSGSRDYRVVAELVPAGTAPDTCSPTSVTLADFTGYGRTIELGAANGERTWRRTQGKVVRNRDDWHTYAVEITPEHIAWFVDAKPVATLTDTAALSGERLSLRLALIAPDATTPMNHTRAGIDWVRHWTLAKAGTGQKKIAKAPAPVEDDAPDC